MQSKAIKASYEKDGRSASRDGKLDVAENVQDLLQLFGGKADELVKFVNDARETVETGKLYQTARLEIVGVDDKIGRLANRLNRDREALGKTPYPAEKALAIAKEMLAD